MNNTTENDEIAELLKLLSDMKRVLENSGEEFEAEINALKTEMLKKRNLYNID